MDEGPAADYSPYFDQRCVDALERVVGAEQPALVAA